MDATRPMMLVVWRIALVFFAVLTLGPAPIHASLTAQAGLLDETRPAFVPIKTVTNSESRTAGNLGRERDGSGIVIDNETGRIEIPSMNRRDPLKLKSTV